MALVLKARSCETCDPSYREDGVLVWAFRPSSEFATSRSFNTWNSRFAGKEVGCIGNHGYMTFTMKGKRVLAHRFIWEMFNGPIPNWMQIDHINGVRTDNRIENLRLADHFENSRNSGKKRSNKSGYKGVYWDKRMEKWCAQITFNRHCQTIGYFDSAWDAAVAYNNTASALHGDFAKLNTYVPSN